MAFRSCPQSDWNRAACSESTGIRLPPPCARAALTIVPAVTIASLFARARFAPDRAAARVERRPAYPVMALTTTSACRDAASVIASSPAPTAPRRASRFTHPWTACDRRYRTRRPKSGRAGLQRRAGSGATGGAAGSQSGVCTCCNAPIPAIAEREQPPAAGAAWPGRSKTNPIWSSWSSAPMMPCAASSLPRP